MQEERNMEENEIQQETVLDEQKMTPLVDSAEEQSEKNPELQLQEKPKTETNPPVPKRKLPQMPKNVSFVTIDEKPGVETDADREKNDLLDMVESLKNKRMLSDYIQGMERSDYTGEAMAIVYHGSFKVVIPASELIDPPEETHGTPINSLMAFLITKRLGSQIDYIVKGIDEHFGIAVASRKKAMEVKAQRYYMGTDRAGNHRLYDNCLAEARVVCVFPSRVYIELFGVETYVTFRELSYQRMTDAAEMFAPGDRILTKILSIDRSDANNIKVTASIKQAQENPLTKALKRYSVGNYYAGVVGLVDVLGVFVTLDGGGECLCDFPLRGRPFAGAKATVKIRDINLDQNRMWGEIMFWSMP